jgi:hypothetical protein
MTITRNAILRKRALSSVLVVTLFSTWLGGCYNTYQVAPQELYKLSGYRDGQTIALSSVEGDSVPFNKRSELKIDAADGQSMKARYAAIDIDGTTMTAVIRGSGAPVNIDLGQVVNAQARNFSVGKSVGLGVGLGVGIPLVIAAIIIGVAVASYNSAVDPFAR